VNASDTDVLGFVAELTDGDGVDVVVDSAGNQITKEQSLQACRAGGAVVWIGLHEDSVTLNSYDITLAEKTVYGSYAASLEELRQAVDLLASGAIKTNGWVQSFALEDGVDAFRRMLAGKGEDIKAVLIP
jgi:threonine dehydrogenase-like Zn-dependent dehydrogenase